MMRLEDALRRLVARALQELRRVDEIGEQDRDGLGHRRHRGGIISLSRYGLGENRGSHQGARSEEAHRRFA